MSQREKFRLEVAEALTNWRLGCVPPRYAPKRELEIFKSGIAEIAGLRLRIAYMPLFQGIERIAARFGVIADLRADPYAPPSFDRKQPRY